MNTIEKRKLLRARRAKRDSKTGRIVAIAFLALASLTAIGAAAGLGVTYALYQNYAEGYVPIEEKLRSENVGLTEIHDRNGIFLGRLTNPDAALLEPVPLDRISPWMKLATISTEDDSFYSHPGFDWRGVLRAAKERYVDKNEESGSGGSSITQQLIKNVYLCPQIATAEGPPVCTSADRTLKRKLKELAYAIELEGDYTKDQILEWYLNQISYGGRYIGVEAAAQGYFKKSAAELTLGEAALLAGLPQFPSRYSPRSQENCLLDETQEEGGCLVVDGRTIVTGESKARQEAVIDLMVEHNRITREQADEAKAEQLAVYPDLNPVRAAAWIDNQVEPRLVRMCEAKMIPQLKGTADCTQSVHSAGYKVTTTIDIIETEAAQAMINEQLTKGLTAGCNCYNAAIATIEPETGQIRIYAANRDPSSTDPRIRGEIDQLTEINQPGSSFKPIVYLAWMDVRNKAPMSTFWDTSPLVVEGTEIRNPRNDGRSSEGLISARAALGGSQNVAAFRAAAEAGTDNVIDVAKKMGITTLDQGFDPTFISHKGAGYGASIATGGANIRAIDLAYANAVMANMGLMVGVPHLAQTVELKDLRGTATDSGVDHDTALAQRAEFSRGHIRLPGTRALDPVTVLRVESKGGELLYDHAIYGDLEKRQVINAGSVWLIHSIIGDCQSRFIIWGCGSSNDDLGLDPFLDKARIPGGAKTGTQQGFKSANDTLETWMNGYSRHSGTAVWVGNANNELVRDGPEAGFAAANATVRLFKNWMGEYHRYLRDGGEISAPLDFESIQPKNVARRGFNSPSTDRGLTGGCSQVVTSWQRTDVKYESECYGVVVDSRNGLLAGDKTPAGFRETRLFVKLPAFKPEGAGSLAARFNIPFPPSQVSTGQDPLQILSPSSGRTVSGNAPVVVEMDIPGLTRWTAEIGAGASPTAWTSIGSGTARAETVGLIDVNALTDGVYTVRVTVESNTGIQTRSVTFNVKKGPANPLTPGATPGPGTPRPTQTPQPPPVITQTPLPVTQQSTGN